MLCAAMLMIRWGVQGAGCALRAALSFPDAALGGAMALSGFLGAPNATRMSDWGRQALVDSWAVEL